MNFSSGFSRWIVIWGSKEGSGEYAGAMSGPDSQRHGNQPDFLDSLPHPPQVILKNGASSRFWRGEASSHALELFWGVSGRSGRSLTIPADDCVDGNPVQELLERSWKKLSEGYHIELLNPLTD
ncbi:hypothetical protein [Bilophila wadsworthia]|uniref:hypothetical protein n=1 Tax=Bilophila wadsworthia TaxID=35833 RepID=UPI00267682C6|nr:hypothetical protein [Bilophila wadsworthia]